jgi:hypothetical protein
MVTSIFFFCLFNFVFVMFRDFGSVAHRNWRSDVGFRRLFLLTYLTPVSKRSQRTAVGGN